MKTPTLDQLPDPNIKSANWPWSNDYKTYSPELKSWPKISIITPSFNQGHYLEETIRSVLLQSYPNLEYIIMDGGSTDNSVEILHKYNPWITYWTSEKDQGQSNAIKKGFEMATGSLFGWLNSDDIYLPGALQKIAATHESNPEALVLGAVQNFISGPERRIISEIQQENISLENLLLPGPSKYSWHQPGIFFPKQLYQEVGGLDPGLHFGMDHDLMCRFLIHRTEQIVLKDPVAGFRVHPSSKTSAQNTWLMVENYQIRIRYWDYLPVQKWKLIIRMKTHFLFRAIKLFLTGNFKDSWFSLEFGIWKNIYSN